MNLDLAKLAPEARACYTRVQRRMREAGDWRDEHALGLAPMAAQCASYLRDVGAVGALKGYVPEQTMRKLEKQLYLTRELAREGLLLFIDLPGAAALNAQGEDAQIAALCAPLPHLIVSLESESA